eukprot:TRINITY_DN3994_c0_g1_i2.p1 TRINITY_DN3994_c0_g1~~TRINITY_DN3994_c0_g1_i2.p1  ORF type:complete len:539 (-),score=108.29 TRINITY_DN3994_c0_g1_i2:67-1560(-)
MQLSRVQTDIEKRLQQIASAVSELRSSVYLAPAEIYKITQMEQELVIQSTQLQLYISELRAYVSSSNTQSVCFSSLVVTEQCFPLVISKGRVLEDAPVTVQLVTGVTTGQVKVSTADMKVVPILADSGTQRAPSTKMTTVHSVASDESKQSFKFILKMTAGTRKSPACIKFSASGITPGGSHVTLETQPTKPFIVITNDCQYDKSDGLLLKKIAFGVSSEIPWVQFANHLQWHYIRATRQDFLAPDRFLTPADLDYLHTKFFDKREKVAQSQFENFWNWFGKLLQKLRYQRHICSMWRGGLIVGFLSREDMQEILVPAQPGTFIIRFSERHPGLFAVGYKVDNNSPLGHYLITPTELGPNRTLPDFLYGRLDWSTIVQVKNDLEGVPLLKVFPKLVAINAFLTKHEPLLDIQGYDPTLIATQEFAGLGIAPATPATPLPVSEPLTPALSANCFSLGATPPPSPAALVQPQQPSGRTTPPPNGKRQCVTRTGGKKQTR